jgi:hypothetical protein
VRAGGEILGQIPGGHNLKPGDPVFFSGRRWAVQTILDRPPTVLLQPSGGGRPPRFAGSPISPSGLVVETMRALLNGQRALPDVQLDPTAEELWHEARYAYPALDLDTTACLACEGDVVILPWTGPRAQATLLAALRHLGLNAGPAHIGNHVDLRGLPGGAEGIRTAMLWTMVPRYPRPSRTAQERNYVCREIAAGLVFPAPPLAESSRVVRPQLR